MARSLINFSREGLIRKCILLTQLSVHFLTHLFSKRNRLWFNTHPTAIEIYQDGDESWTPYGSMLNDYVYVVSIDGLHELIEELKNKSDAEISVMESKIESLREDYFTYGGILEQIRLFLTEPSRSALTCRKLPQTSGTTDSFRWPRGHQCIKTST